MNELLIKILKIQGINPDKICSNGQNALEYLEGCILGAMDELLDEEVE